jgi:hypothetical protein
MTHPRRKQIDRGLKTEKRGSQELIRAHPRQSAVSIYW